MSTEINKNYLVVLTQAEFFNLCKNYFLYSFLFFTFSIILKGFVLINSLMFEGKQLRDL
jgi:hypothetical protein